MPGQNTPKASPSRVDFFVVTGDAIDAYIADCAKRGFKKPTLHSYRHYLEKFRSFLPEDGVLKKGGIEGLPQYLLSLGYTQHTVNSILAIVDSFLVFHNHWDLRLGKRLDYPELDRAELTRKEYLRLLSAAKKKDNIRLYLLIKVFATLGLRLEELKSFTVEVVQQGYLIQNDERQRIPDCLRQELLYYIDQEGLTSGPVFLSNRGNPMARTHITVGISALADDAWVDGEKCNPSSLRRLYQRTQAEILSSLKLLIEQANERIVNQEQSIIGWHQEPHEALPHEREAAGDAYERLEIPVNVRLRNRRMHST